MLRRFVVGASAIMAAVMLLTAGACGATSTPAVQPTGGAPSTEATTAPSAATNKSGGVMVWGVAGDPPGFNPILNDDMVDLYIAHLGYQPLTWGGENYPTELKPILATSWETSADGLVWTIHLRPNVKWSDGKAFSADDVLFWAQAVQDPETGAEYFMERFYVDDEPFKFEKVDDLTVKVTTASPVPGLLNDICLPIIPEHYFQQNNIANADMMGDKSNTDGAMPAIGPFMVNKYDRGEAVTLVRNDNFWGSKAYLDSIVFRIIPDPQSMNTALQNGEVDWNRTTPDNASLLTDQPNVALKIVDVDSVRYIAVNVNRPIMSDKRTRQALMIALDRPSIIQGAVQGYGKLLQDIWSPAVTAYQAQTPDYAHDLDAAKALLAQVGWKPGADGVLVASGVAGVADGTRFEVDYVFFDGNDKIPPMVQSMWKDVGVNVTLRQMDLNAFYGVARGKADKPYDACSWSYGWFGSNAGAYLTVYGTGDPSTNWASYANKEVADLFAKAKSLPAGAEADKVYKQASKIIWDELPHIPLFMRQNIWGVSNKLHLEEAGMNPLLYAVFAQPEGIWKEK